MQQDSVAASKKSSYGGAGASMMRFLKNNSEDPFKQSNGVKPLGLGSSSSAAPTLFFRQRKNKAA